MTCLRRAGASACVCLLLIALASVAGADESFRMPTYPAEAPPPPRSRAEVEALLADPVSAVPCGPARKASLHIVLVAGPKDHGPGEHDYPAWQEVWKRLLARTPNTTVDTAWEFPSQEQIDKADVLIFYQRGRWDKERAAAIDPFLARGGGCVYIHWAVDGQGGQEEFAKRIGLASLGGAIKYRHGPLDVDFTLGKYHEIGRKFDRVKWVDESYWELTGDPKKINLLATCEEEGQPQPLFWTVGELGGRVFVSIPGHYMWTFDDPAFRLLLLRGIAWAGGADPDRFNDLVWLDARVE